MKTAEEYLRKIKFVDETEHTVTVTATIDKRDNRRSLLTSEMLMGGVLFGPETYYLLISKFLAAARHNRWRAENPEKEESESEHLQNFMELEELIVKRTMAIAEIISSDMYSDFEANPTGQA